MQVEASQVEERVYHDSGRGNICDAHVWQRKEEDGAGIGGFQSCPVQFRGAAHDHLCILSFEKIHGEHLCISLLLEKHYWH